MLTNRSTLKGTIPRPRLLSGIVDLQCSQWAAKENSHLIINSNVYSVPNTSVSWHSLPVCCFYPSIKSQLRGSARFRISQIQGPSECHEKGCLLEKQHVLWLRESSQSTHVCSLLSSSTAVRADIKVLLIWHTFFMWCAGFLETKAKAFLWRHHCFCSVGGHGSSLHLRQVWMWCFRSGLQVQKNIDLWVL